MQSYGMRKSELGIMKFELNPPLPPFKKGGVGSPLADWKSALQKRGEIREKGVKYEK